MRLANVRVYPVKSTRGLRLDEVLVEPWGLRDDRRWLVVDDTGRTLTARENPRLLSVTATPQADGGLLLTAPSRHALRVDRPDTSTRIPAPVSRLDTVAGCDPATDAWLSELLGQSVRLGWLDDPRRRPVSPAHGGRPGDRLSLADAGPLLLTSTTSLATLNGWIAAERAEHGEPARPPLSMARFRPNVVVEGAAEPFAEDGWKRLSIGPVEFRVAEHCDRCVLTMIDPDTLERGHEPIRTLARYRRRNSHVWFGVRLVPLTTGTLRTGDPVQVH